MTRIILIVLIAVNIIFAGAITFSTTTPTQYDIAYTKYSNNADTLAAGDSVLIASKTQMSFSDGWFYFLASGTISGGGNASVTIKVKNLSSTGSRVMKSTLVDTLSATGDFADLKIPSSIPFHNLQIWAYNIHATDPAIIKDLYVCRGRPISIETNKTVNDK